MKKLLNKKYITYLLSVLIIVTGILASYYLYVIKASDIYTGMFVEVNSTYIETEYTIPKDVKYGDLPEGHEDKTFWSYPGALLETNFKGSVSYYADTNPNEDISRFDGSTANLTSFDSEELVTLRARTKGTGAIRYDDLDGKVFYMHTKFRRSSDGKSFIRTYPIYTSQVDVNNDLISSWPSNTSTGRGSDEQTVTLYPTASETSVKYPQYNKAFEVYSTAVNEGKELNRESFIGSISPDTSRISYIWNRYNEAFKNKAESSAIEEIKVLNVYPVIDGSDALKSWMMTDGSFAKFGVEDGSLTTTIAVGGYGRRLIKVETKPIDELTRYTDLSKFDLIAFGSWDSNNFQDISSGALDNVINWMNSGDKNIILGHDTCIDQNLGEHHPNFMALASRYLGIEPKTTIMADTLYQLDTSESTNPNNLVADYTPWVNGRMSHADDPSTHYNYQGPSWRGLDIASYHSGLYGDYAWGSKGSHVSQTTAAESSLSSFLTYPWNISMDNLNGSVNYLDVPICHTTGQVWETTSPSTSYLAFHNQDYYRYVFRGGSATWDAVKNNKNLAYLTVNNDNSVALIQTGHSKADAIEQEKQIWANLIFSLCSKEASSDGVKAPLVDANGPEISSATYDPVTDKINLVTADKETKNYFTVNTTDTSGYNFALSKLQAYGWASGVKGFKYFFSDAPISDLWINDYNKFIYQANKRNATIKNLEIPLANVQPVTLSIQNSISTSGLTTDDRYCYVIAYDYSKRTYLDDPNHLNISASNPNYGNVVRIEIDKTKDLTLTTSLTGGDYTSNDNGYSEIRWNRAGSDARIYLSGSVSSGAREVKSLDLALSSINSPPTSTSYVNSEVAKRFLATGPFGLFLKESAGWMREVILNESVATNKGSINGHIHIKSGSGVTREGVEMKIFAKGSATEGALLSAVSTNSLIQDNTPPEIKANYSNGVCKIDYVIDSFKGDQQLASGITKVSYFIKNRETNQYGAEKFLYNVKSSKRTNRLDDLLIPEAAYPDINSGVKIIAIDNVGNETVKEIPFFYITPQDPILPQESGEIRISNYDYNSRGDSNKWVNKNSNFTIDFNSNVSTKSAKEVAYELLGNGYDRIDSFTDSVSRTNILKLSSLGNTTYTIDAYNNRTDLNDSTLIKNSVVASKTVGYSGNKFNAMLDVKYDFNAKTSNDGVYEVSGIGLVTNRTQSSISGYESYEIYHPAETKVNGMGIPITLKSAWTETAYRPINASSSETINSSKTFYSPSNLCIDGTKPLFECRKIGRYEASFSIKDTGSGINQILIKGATSKGQAEEKGGVILVKSSTRGSLSPTAVDSSYPIVNTINSSDGSSVYPTLQLYGDVNDKKNTAYQYVYYQITDNVGNVTEGTVGPLVTTVTGSILIDGKDVKTYPEVPFDYGITYPHGPSDIPVDSKFSTLRKDKNLVATPTTVKKDGIDRKILHVVGNLTVVNSVPGFDPMFRFQALGRDKDIISTSFTETSSTINQTIPALGGRSIFKKELYIDDTYNTPVKPNTKENRDPTYSYLEWEKMTDPKLPYFFSLYSKVSAREDFNLEIDSRYPIFFASGYHHDKVIVFGVNGDKVQPTPAQRANPKISKDVEVSTAMTTGRIDTSFLRSGWYKSEITMYDYNGNPSGTSEYWFYHEQPALYTPYKVSITAVKDIDWENLNTKYLDYGETYYRPTDEEGNEVTVEVNNGSDKTKFPLGKIWGAKGTALKRITDGGNPIAKGYAVNWEFRKENNVELESLELRYSFKSESGEALKIMQNGSTIAKDFTDTDGSKSFFTLQKLTEEQLKTLNLPTLVVGQYPGSPNVNHFNSTVSIKHFLPVNFVAYTSSTNQLYSGPVTVNVQFHSTARNSYGVLKWGVVQSIDLYTIDQVYDALDDMNVDKQR